MVADGTNRAAAGDRGAERATDLEIEVGAEHEAVVVVVRGDIDAMAAPALSETLAEVIDRVPGTVRIDMAAVDFLDSVGISVLVASCNRAQDLGVSFELSSVPPSSRRVLEITRLADILTILD